MIVDTPEASDLRAAVFVLGCLDAEERRKVSELAHSDKDFAARVDRWSERLFPLAEAFTPEPPDPRLWEGIERSLPREPVKPPAPFRLGRGRAGGAHCLRRQ